MSTSLRSKCFRSMGLSGGKGLKGYKVAREDIEKLDTTFSSSGTFASSSSAAEHTYQQFLYAKIFMLTN